MIKYTGGCLCGKIHYTITGRPSFPHFCSCHMCQRWSSAPIVAWVDFPLKTLVWDGPGKRPSMFRSSKGARRGFCSKCGSTLFALDDGSDKICMTVATLDNPNLIVPRSQSFPESAPSWLIVKTKAPKKFARKK